MATKANPGRFDCYAKADPNEPMFILLGRDAMAPFLVRMWAHMRWLNGEDRGKVAEALTIAYEMEHFRVDIKRGISPDYEMGNWLESFIAAFSKSLPDPAKR